MKRWTVFPMVLILLPSIGISGCANPADYVVPATTSEAKAIPAAPALPGPGVRGGIREQAGQFLPEALTGAVTAITPDNATIGFVGSKVTGSHVGGFKLFKGTFEVVPTKLESSKITAEIDTSWIFTDNDRVTNHLKSPDFFDVAKFPHAPPSCRPESRPAARTPRPRMRRTP